MMKHVNTMLLCLLHTVLMQSKVGKRRSSTGSFHQVTITTTRKPPMTAIRNVEANILLEAVLLFDSSVDFTLLVLTLAAEQANWERNKQFDFKESRCRSATVGNKIRDSKASSIQLVEWLLTFCKRNKLEEGRRKCVFLEVAFALFSSCSTSTSCFVRFKTTVTFYLSETNILWWFSVEVSFEFYIF